MRHPPNRFRSKRNHLWEASDWPLKAEGHLPGRGGGPRALKAAPVRRPFCACERGHGLYAAFLRKSSIFWGFSGFKSRGSALKGTCCAEHACVSPALGVVSLCLARGWGFVQRVAGLYAGGQSGTPEVNTSGYAGRPSGNINRNELCACRIEPDTKSVKDR